MSETTMATLKAWRDDLRTTTAKQGRGKFGSAADGFCCLGRLCVVTHEGFDQFEAVPFMSKHPIAHAAYSSAQAALGASFVAANDCERCTFDEIADLVDIAILELEDAS